LRFQCRHRFAGGFELDLAFETAHLVTSLFGPSGSGKTSVLEVIAGVLRPKQAVIELDEHTLVDTKRGIELAPERRGVGIIFQDQLLFPHLSVEDNLRYGAGRPTANGRAIEFDRVVEVLELKELLGRPPRTLSGGERQRVALGRALLSKPDWLLMDEPLVGLDEALKLRILTYVERIVDQWQIPTLLVSHNQAEVRRLSQWVIVVEQGKLVTAGQPDEALEARPLAGPL
jgi:molybdate transport system ATP-binding protein